MKFKATKKEIKKHYGDSVLAVGYCGAEALLRGCDDFAYSAGVYGWACDYYKINGLIICTGYNTIGKDINKITNDYEKKAEAISKNYDMNWREKDARIAAIREEWMQSIAEGV